MTDETDKRALAVKVAQLYYQNDWRQSRIAAELSLSRPTVSRLLQYARESGIVQIRINNPLVSTQQLADQLKAHYHLSNAIVVPSEMTASGELLELVGAAAAQYIEKVVKNDDTIGLAWGKTIHAIAQHLSPEDVHGVTVVQLKGSVANTKQKNYAFESVNAFASAFHTLPQYLPLPVIFDHQTTKELVEQDTHIKYILDLGKKADIAVFTVGTVRDSALLFHLGYFSQAEQQYLQQHAVGDVFSRFIDQNGQIVAPQIDQRTIGIDLEHLKKIPERIMVIANPAKVQATAGALQAGYANVLVIDQGSAAELVKKLDESKGEN
ncbi:sugar-binding transcriptional regulator [Limosilactobacillus mucosae]|mgnify:FL=1|uniref:sugar-binding transcriptional regulator n=1 Tax=Lactobacillaceae TaxID=33958 RepID=UPI00146B7B4C|nr:MULTISPECIES: sugar-binding transcriptional regulator [Lactobacillaceae]MDC2841671.1 sugar-binding transcriptional regulator [Limosilactobacillus mucosae]MDC2845088.1 sugar-binding transcriptional regulator [Limosilactobacillus mucosae]MDD6893053.1 sugar-binding transcriptional regulator [Lactobacillus sp.]NME34091.1 sugar-binding transcriptional regulator [Lactobacillus sp. MRS-253-APC-2B]